MNAIQSRFSTGVDLVEVPRFSKLLSNKKFISNTFTKKELAQCNLKSNRDQSLAVRFAAKEAVTKSIEERLKFNIIEVLNNKEGRPEVRLLHKKIQKKYQFALSLSHTNDYAIATCITNTYIAHEKRSNRK